MPRYSLEFIGRLRPFVLTTTVSEHEMRETRNRGTGCNRGLPVCRRMAGLGLARGRKPVGRDRRAGASGRLEAQRTGAGVLQRAALAHEGTRSGAGARGPHVEAAPRRPGRAGATPGPRAGPVESRDPGHRDVTGVAAARDRRRSGRRVRGWLPAAHGHGRRRRRHRPARLQPRHRVDPDHRSDRPRVARRRSVRGRGPGDEHVAREPAASSPGS